MSILSGCACCAGGSCEKFFSSDSFNAQIGPETQAGGTNQTGGQNAPDLVPGSIASTVILPFGAPINGEIDTLGDHDFYRITLTAGQTYTFVANAFSTAGTLNTLTDTVFRLVDSVGTQVAINDDAGPSDLLSQIIFTAQTSGTYFLDVGAFNNASTGTFRVSAATSLAGSGDTVAGDFTTTAAISVGGASVNGIINALGDHDWHAVTLIAGQSYFFRTSATGATGDVDSTITLHNSAGAVLGFNDDGGGGTYSQLRFTATTSGTYYVDVRGFADNETGAYKLTAEIAPPLPVFTNDQIADQLTNGFWGGPSGARHFAVTSGGTITVNISTLSAAGQFLAHEALALWTDVTGITFSEIATAASITFSDAEVGAFATAARTGNITTSANVNVGTGWLTTNGTAINSYSFQTYIHEIGHALGLGHAGNYNSTASYASDALYQNDSWATTIMSYFDQRENVFFNTQGFSRFFAVSPQIADVLAITQTYGASTVTRTGDTQYGFGNTSGRAIYDAATNPNVSYTIFDSGGIDTLNYSGFSANQKINLNPETFSNVGNGIGNVSIARGVVVENANGGSGNDILIGNAAANQLNGGTGDDTIEGGAGDDVLVGGAGIDTISYASSSFGVTVHLDNATAQNTVQQGIDTISGFENILGSSQADMLFGDDNDNVINGGAGFDTITGGGGTNTLIGGADGDLYFVQGVNDIVVEAVGGGYDIVLSQVNFALAAGAEVEALAVNTSAGISLTGNEFQQFLTGNVGNDTLDGGGGNDLIISGLGTNTLIGGTGDDIYYSEGLNDVITEAAGGGFDVVLASGNLTLAANSEVEFIAVNTANGVTITGSNSNQTIQGAGGNDRLVGGLGNDRLQGSGGADTFVLGNTFADRDFIVDFASGADRLEISAALFGGGLAAGMLSANQFLSGAGAVSATTADQRFIYNSSNGNLLFDADGNGAGAAVLFASILNVPVLTAADFLIAG